MNLLIITQRVDKNDDDLGFFHEWLRRFALEARQLIVVGQYVGEYDFPPNVKVFSLGKEKNFSKIRQLLNFYTLLFQQVSRVDAVFIHMIPMWAVLGWPVFKLRRRNVFLWYVHKSVGFWLKLAEKIVKNIFTASAESFRLPSRKIIITGHGIDAEFFKPLNQKPDQRFTILTAGRIAPVKNLDILIKASVILKKEGVDFSLEIAGSPRLEKDKEYFKKLRQLAREQSLGGEIKFTGAIPYKRIAEFYQRGDLFVNLSQTGSVDKAVLEAMSCGLNILTSNEAFFKILPDENIVKNPTPQNLAGKIEFFLENPNEPGFDFRDYVAQNHNLDKTIKKIIQRISA